MQFADPTLIILMLSVLADLILLLTVQRSQAIRARVNPEFSRGGQVRLILLLMAYLLASLSWTVVQGLFRLQVLHLVRGFDTFALQRIGLYILLAMAVVFYRLTRQFQRRDGTPLPIWIAGAVMLVICLVLYENPLRLPDRFFPLNGYIMVRVLLAFAVFLIGWGLALGGAGLLTLRSLRDTVSPLHRNRILYWSMTILLAAAGQALVLARLDNIGNLLQLATVMALVYVVLVYNLPDLRLAFRRSASYLVMLLLTVSVYTGGFLGIQYLSQRITGYQAWMVGGALALALAALFNPLLNTVKLFINRLFSGAHYDPRQTLSDYSKSISNILEMDVLASTMVGMISEAMDITYGALVTVHRCADLTTAGDGADVEDASAMVDSTAPADDGPFINESGGYILRSISGQGDSLPITRISAKNPAVSYLRRDHRPLTQYDIDLLPRFHGMDPTERAWLSNLKMDVFVPIYAKDTWIGLLALGPKTSRDRYYDEDLAFLQTLADQTAVALENARLYDDLKHRNRDNERLNRELKSANAELARLDKAKSDFINIASHELRTPLTQVIGYNDILGELTRSDEFQPEVAGQMINSVRKAARRLEEIVETMFDVSKLDTNTLDLRSEPVWVCDLVEAAAQTWSKGMQERSLNLVKEGIEELPPIMADSQRLTKVFSQLIQNAVKSTPDGRQIRVSGRVIKNGHKPPVESPPVEASSASTAAAGPQPEAAAPALAPIAVSGTAETEKYPWIEIVVTDSGIGIAPEDLERIFEKFYRVGNVLLHSTGDTKFKGAGPGLGLTIARGIVEAHGGKIWAESPGHDETSCPGAAFHVMLPVRETVDDLN